MSVWIRYFMKVVKLQFQEVSSTLSKIQALSDLPKDSQTPVQTVVINSKQGEPV